MLYGLSGAHSTGKTTMAQRFSEEYGMPFLHFDTREVIAKAGASFTTMRDLRERLRVQRLIVQRADELFMRSREPKITDRTPLDIAAYTLADMTQASDGDRWAQDEAMAIIEDCIDLTNLSFMGILHIPPAIPYKPEPGRPELNLAYQAHHHHLVLGLLADQRQNRPWYLLNSDRTDLEDRVETMQGIWEALTEDDTLLAEVETIN